MIKAVVFDLDHTLFDRYETLKKVAPHLKEHFKINTKYSDSEIADLMVSYDKNFVHLGWRRLQDEIINSDIFLEKIKKEDYHDFVMSQFMKIAVPYSFTNPMLDELKSLGYKLALITNGIPHLQRQKLKMLNIGHYFDYIYIGGDHEFQKPHTEPFLITANKLNVLPSECVYVGDNPENDIEASRKAGYIPIHINTTGNWTLPHIEKPNFMLETVEAVPEIIKKINQEC